MLKRLFVTGLLVVAPAGMAFADPDIGCGPGTQIWQGNTGVPPKVLGATTNGTFGLQTFGITFGTLGCNQGGTVTAQARLQMFASANLDRLARDMAHGNGDTLDAFAHLLGVSDTDKPAFFAFTKTHFVDLFASEEVTSGEVLASLNRLMADDAQLADYAIL